MYDTIRVDFHCHSVHSDGTLTPRELADVLAADGVVAAALADHNSVDGQAEFRRALARHEIGCIPAVEITTQCDDREAHLLAYGIDLTHPELLATLASLRQASMHGVQSVAGALRTRGSAPPESDSASAEGRITIGEAIALVHRAGGRAFLAHPLVLEPDLAALDALVGRLKALGLDGLEAFYAPCTPEERARLSALADAHGLLVSAGSDLHERKARGSAGVEIPVPHWKAFRDAVCDGAAPAPAPAPAHRPRTRLKWRAFFFHVIFPTLLAIGLFIAAVYAIILPTFERSLLERKREMIRELTNSAHSILVGYERDEQAGRLSRAQAQALAASRIKMLRYGPAGKDYFWLQDMTPRMIMHPYRAELNGQNVSTLRDQRGVAIFVRFADVVRQRGEGYVQYVWQWNDDPTRLVPKESYLKGFQPWGWIIGTGIYIEDVTQEIARIERSLVQTTLVIAVIVVLLLLYVVLESLRLERERAEVEESLRDSTERYRSLVEATTEGTLLVLDGRCRYANPIFLTLLGASAQELELLDLADIFPATAENDTAWAHLHRLLAGDEAQGGFDAMLRNRGGTLIECVITPSRIAVGERQGFILLCRAVGMPGSGADASEKAQLEQAIDESPVGIFRARLTARGTVIACNRTAMQLFASGEAPATLADLFHDAALYDEFLQHLKRDGMATRRLMLDTPGGRRTVVLTTRLARDDNGTPRAIDGLIDDVTEQERREVEREAVVTRLQTTLLFLHEPISRVRRHVVCCPLETPVSAVAALMTDQQADAALLQADGGDIVGILTDSDIRRRVMAAGLAPQVPAHRVMSAPLITIAEQAVIYEALLLMEQRNVQHLAVADEAGRIVGVVRNQELMQFRNYGAIVLAREVEEATTPEDVVRSCRRVPELTRALLDCGAHPHLITRMISTVCHAATTRLILLAQEVLGPSPVPFVFIALGSQGRQEMTLASDQDNAIIYEAGDPEAQARAETYLPALGRFVCDWLDRAGYPLCHGQVMARNPRWCQPLGAWQRDFSDWIARAEPQQLLEFTIFFDFYPVYGDMALARALREHVFARVQAHPAFFAHFAQNALQFKPPVRLFGRYLGGAGESGGHLDMKDAMMPLVSFARLYALRQQLDVPHTLDRLQALATTDALPAASCREITDTYEFLMRLRLRQQSEAIVTGQPQTNTLAVRRLTQSEQTLLAEAFTQIAAVQKRISYEFLGNLA
jgi:PAS domain S-box-containing protein